MVKSREDVIREFNEEVNMSVDELEKWLEDPKSTKAGTGVGIESGHKIIEVLRKNPEKDPEKYDEEDIAHMRKVVSYAKRHLAQEDHLKDTKTRAELENTKSTISLKNWGHDPVKSLDEEQAENEEPQKDGNQDTDDPTLADAEGEEADEGVSEAPADKVEAHGRTKRKLDEDDTGDGDGDDREEETGHDGANGDSEEANADETGQEDRPRKKSKVDEDA
ncbi:hypothetical protein C8Q73DRAFT_717886 [Cubamyces lactineus]|nr:hypothetical protein C8Q73DRAFT_717886 [Cubamyces lactineus]